MFKKYSQYKPIIILKYILDRVKNYSRYDLRIQD